MEFLALLIDPLALMLCLSLRCLQIVFAFVVGSAFVCMHAFHAGPEGCGCLDLDGDLG